MASNGPERSPSPASGGGLQALLARLRAARDAKEAEPGSSPGEAEQPAEVAEAPAVETRDHQAETPVAAEDETAGEVVPTGLDELAGVPPEDDRVEGSTDTDVSESEVAEPAEAASVPTGEAAPPTCPFCGAARVAGLTYCNDCGLVFPVGPPVAGLPLESSSGVRLMERYELGELISERGDVCRYRGRDHGAGTPEPLPVILVRCPVAPAALPAAPVDNDPVTTGEDEILPNFDVTTLPTVPKVEVPNAAAVWPSLGWEREVLEKARHPALPQISGTFEDNGFAYLVQEVPPGRLLWDAWDDPDTTADQRYGWLKQIAEGLHQLHQAGAMLEGLRPDIIVIAPSGQAMLTDLSDLLPLPVPEGAPVRGTLYTAPELLVSPEKADARAALYSFGATLYALHVGRELTETAFDRPGVPKPLIPYFPDIHPLFGRLVSKTFCQELEARFPTEEASREDPTGFAELIRTLEVCRRVLGNARLEIAAWTTTGMVRTGNEDAFALVHAIESRQDDLGEFALILLADGMGGYEAGEVASGMAIHAIRQSLLGHPLFAALAGDAPPPPGDFRLEDCKEAILTALKEANKRVSEAARSGQGRRGMGCTAEAVYVDGRHVVVGHVGDSRTYHLRRGRLVQITRDQTLVGRLLELGQLTEEEAAAHPRRSELQQAIGGRTDVDPELYHAPLSPGDWILVCSDGLSNHVRPEELQEMMQSEATSAEMAARRLVNFANLRGANDNATVVVIRAT
jgi:protein phosphatase